MTTIVRGDAAWRQFFAERGITPLQVSYEELEHDPDAFVRAVARLTDVADSVTIDPSAIAVSTQRDALNDACGSASPAMRRRALPWRPPLRPGPRVSVHVITRSSADRLERLIGEAQSYADEVIVGVDATSDDATFEVASAFADVVYRFRLPRAAQLGPARMLAFEYASGDWILSIDDDESMEPAFDALLPELLAAPDVTHYYFPRKWIAREEPCLYAHGEPWFPNWAPRLFRNDRALFWKPPQPHSMYLIEGPSAYEERDGDPALRARLVHAGAARAFNFDLPRRGRQRADSEAHYGSIDDAPLRPATVRPPVTAQRRNGFVAPGRARAHGPGRPAVARANAHARRPRGHAARGRARDGDGDPSPHHDGALAWMPTYSQWPAESVADGVSLDDDLLAADEIAIDCGARTRMEVRRTVRPGDSATFIGDFDVPPAPGDDAVVWDMVSEGHCWFAQCGSPVFRQPITVE